MCPSTEVNPRANTAPLSSFSVTYDTVDCTYVGRLLGLESSRERWTHLHAIRARSYMMWMKEGSVGGGSCLLRLILGPINKEEQEQNVTNIQGALCPPWTALWRAHMMEGPNFLGELHNPLAFWRPSGAQGSEKLPNQQLKKYSVCFACKKSPTAMACAL